MANEIKCQYAIDITTLYACVFNSSGQVYDLTDPGWETFDDSLIDRYDIPLTEVGDNSGLYTGTFPAIVAGVYTVVCYNGDKGNPNDDTVIGNGEMCWDGTAEITRSALDALIDTVKAETASIQVETTALDTLTKASGDGDLAAVLADTNELQGDDIPTLIAALPTDANVQTAADAAITANTKIIAIESDTDELQAELADGGRTDALIDVIDGLADDIKSYLVDGGRIDLLLDNIVSAVATVQLDLDIVTGADGAIVATDGLALLANTEPTGEASTWTLQEWLSWLIRRFANKQLLTDNGDGTGTLVTKKDNDTDALSSQVVSETTTIQTVNKLT